MYGSVCIICFFIFVYDENLKVKIVKRKNYQHFTKRYINIYCNFWVSIPESTNMIFWNLGLSQPKFPTWPGLISSVYIWNNRIKSIDFPPITALPNHIFPILLTLMETICLHISKHTVGKKGKADRGYEAYCTFAYSTRGTRASSLMPTSNKGQQ